MKTNLEVHNQLKKTEEEIPSSSGDFRRLLQDTLINRCKANSSYSLRAFAKQIQLEPSFLSKLLSGKRRATHRVISKVANRLSLSPEETQTYISGASKKPSGPVEQTEYQNLAMDHFRMIADWYHYAILELTLLQDFESDASWIAKKLGIKKIEAQAALERLERLEMLTKNKKGEYENTSGNNTTVGNEFTAVAFRKLQKQILTQALHALENDPIEKRDQSSMTMAIDPALIPQAKEKIKKFRRELCTFLQENNRPKKEVYQLSVSLFAVTETKTKGAVK